jgi:hypothetical protein
MNRMGCGQMNGITCGYDDSLAHSGSTPFRAAWQRQW